MAVPTVVTVRRCKTGSCTWYSSSYLAPLTNPEGGEIPDYVIAQLTHHAATHRASSGSDHPATGKS